MVYEKNELVENPQKTIALNFGFKKNFKWEDTKTEKRITGNTEHTCRMCGKVQDEVIFDPKKELIGPKSNNMYDYKDKTSKHVCVYCYYNSKTYMKKWQAKMEVKKGDMANVIIFNKKIQHIDFSSNKKNELYDLFVKPPKEAFILIGRVGKGPSIENETFMAVPTIDSELFCLNNKKEPLFVGRKTVLRCVKEANEILVLAKKKKLNLSPEVLFNRMTDEMYNNYFSPNLRKDKEVHDLVSAFVTKYDKGTRYVSKVIFERYLFEIKKKKKE